MVDAFEIIENYHKKAEPKPVFCPKCKGEMKVSGRRTSASIEYDVWKCLKCGHENAQFKGLDERAKNVIDQINKQVK